MCILCSFKKWLKLINWKVHLKADFYIKKWCRRLFVVCMPVSVVTWYLKGEKQDTIFNKQLLHQDFVMKAKKWGIHQYKPLETPTFIKSIILGGDMIQGRSQLFTTVLNYTWWRWPMWTLAMYKSNYFDITSKKNSITFWEGFRWS